MVYRYFLRGMVCLATTIGAGEKEIVKKWNFRVIPKAERIEARVDTLKRDFMREGLIDKVKSNGLLKLGKESYVNFFAVTGLLLERTMEYKSDNCLLQKLYTKTKEYIDTKYKNYLEDPSTLEREGVQLISSSPKLRSHQERREYQGEIAALYKEYENSSASDEEKAKIEEYKEVVLKYSLPQYDKSFQRSLRCKSRSERYKLEFYKAYQEAEEAYTKKDYLVAYRAIDEAYRLAHLSLINFSESHQEKETLRIVSPLLKNVLSRSRSNSSSSDDEAKFSSRRNSIVRKTSEEFADGKQEEDETGKETVPDDM